MGRVCKAPCALQLTESDVVEPDIIVVLQDKIQEITPTRIKCVPHLLIEILSPTTRKHDTGRKKQLYEQVGVPEYWIVDPLEHHVEQWLLDKSGHYADSILATESVTFHGLADGVTVDLTRVW